MGYSHRWSGQITIDPPIPVADLGAPFLPDWRGAGGEIIDVQFRVAEVPVPEAPGAYRRVATAIGTAMDTFSGYEVQKQLQGIVNRYRAGHTFGGHIEVQWEEGGAARYYVRDGVVEQVHAVLLWPGDNLHVVERRSFDGDADPLAAFTDAKTAARWAARWTADNGHDMCSGVRAEVVDTPVPLNPTVG